MKKTILSTVAISAMAMTGVYADTSSDIAEMKAMMKQMSERLAKLEAENKTLKATQKKQEKSVKQVKKKQESAKTTVAAAEETPKIKQGTFVKSKVPKLEFSGKHYLGFVSRDSDDYDGRSNRFETRRNYFQVKSYFGEESKSYMRITLDTFQNDGDDEDAGSWEVRLKYAYIYLDNILPYTGVEFGQSHRPWIDYEEHGGWNYRSISKVLVEQDNGAHLTNSADLGVNFKTKMDYFSSELGLFNGEGYHAEIEDDENPNKLSAEWRLTAHLLGTGKEKRKRALTYADISSFGQWNADSNKHGDEDLNWYGFHAVYNQPEFLIAAQYVDTVDAPDGLNGSTKNYAGSGYSFNGEYRFMKDWNLIARYDNFEKDNSNFGKQEITIAGVTYMYNKYVELIANYLGDKNYEDKGIDQDAFMFTAEVNW